MAKLYYFRGADNIVKLKVYGNKCMEICTQLTSFRFVPLRKVLKHEQYDILQDRLNEITDEKEFEEYLLFEFQKMGYTALNKGGTDDI